MTRASILVLAALTLSACGEPELRSRAQVLIGISTDKNLEPQLARVDVEVRDERGVHTASEHGFALNTHPLPLSFGVYQASEGDEWFLLIARGVSLEGKLLVEQKVLAKFVKAQTGLLQVNLSSNCLGIFCNDALTLQSCYGEVGACADVERITPELAATDDAGTASAAPSAPVSTAPPTPPTTHGVVTLGGARSDGVITLSQEGFEMTERRCTTDRQYCVAAGLVP